MQGSPRARLLLGVLAVAFLLLAVVALRREDRPEWAKWQDAFRALRVQHAQAAVDEATKRADAAAAARARTTLAEYAAEPAAVQQIYLAEIGVVDRCITCHRGVVDPAFADAPQPFRTHPGDLLRVHDVDHIGCTPCHQGDGLATTAEAAHARGPGAAHPMLPRAYVQATCLRCHEVAEGLRGAETVARGGRLFLERGCYACHDAPGIAYRPKFGPPLTALDAKLADARGWVAAWVKDPRRIRRDTAMPYFGLTDDEVAKITAFLFTRQGKASPLPPVDLGDASAETGKRLFVERGCRGCHGTSDDDPSVAPRVPNLAGVGTKIRVEWLDRWIAGPRALVADAAMPTLALSDEERHALVAYLRASTMPRPAAPTVDPASADAAAGEQLVRQYECAGCHAIEGFETVRPAVPDLGEFSRRSVDELDFGLRADVPRTKWDWLLGKLADPRGYARENITLRMPQVPVADDERAALVTWVLGAGLPPFPSPYRVAATPARRARREAAWMTAFRHCNGCHRLDGADARLARFFERKNMLPPVLDGVGARLQGEYLYRFLLEPAQVRPWLELRMPQFGFRDAEAQTLVEGLAAAGGAAPTYTWIAPDRLPADRVERGKKRFAHFKCGQCHPTSFEHGLPEGVAPEDVSINLMLVKTRLRPDWIARFLARPKEIAGVQTRMPTVFYTIDGTPKVEHPDDDIDAITQYLMGMTEPPEETAQAEAEQKKAEEKQAIDWSTYKY